MDYGLQKWLSGHVLQILRKKKKIEDQQPYFYLI